MTTHVLYHALGVDGYTATRCWEREGVFCLQMEAPSSCHRCPKCGRGDVIHRGTFDRTVHAPPNWYLSDSTVYQGTAIGMSQLPAGIECGDSENCSALSIHPLQAHA